MREKPQQTDPGQPRSTTSAPSPAANPIRLLLVDDKLVLREGVRALLDREPGLHVVAQASSVAEAVAVDVRPDVVVTDAALPDARGNEVVVRLRRRYAQAAIFVLIDRDQTRPEEIVGAGASDGGVRGYAFKTATAAEFLAGLRTVAQGIHYVQPSLRSGIAPAGVRSPMNTVAPISDRSREQLVEPADEAAFGALTEKEREVLDLLVLGHTNAEIAVRSRVSLRTVEARRARLLQKLGVRTRADLVQIARHLF